MRFASTLERPKENEQKVGSQATFALKPLVKGKVAGVRKPLVNDFLGNFFLREGVGLNFLQETEVLFKKLKGVNEFFSDLSWFARVIGLGLP